MKPVKYGKYISGDSLNKVLPRLEYLKLSMTIFELKQYVLEKVKYIYKK